MSRERRIIRPYTNVEQFQRLLDGVHLSFGERTVAPGGLVTTTTSDFLRQPVGLMLAPDREQMAQFATSIADAAATAGLDPSALELLVVLRTPRLKLSEVVWRWPIDELRDVNHHVPLTTEGGRPAPLQTPFGGCTASVYVVLSRRLEPAPLKPWREGTWLARTHHKIKTNVNEIGFTPMELTDEIRGQHGLPADTLRYALVEDPLTEASGPESIVLYIDTEVFSELAANPKTDAAKALQTELFLIAMSAAVTESSLKLNIESVGSVDDIEGSLAHKLILLVTGDGPGSSAADQQKHHFRMLRDHPAQFLAHVEARVPDFRKSTVDTLRGSAK